MITNYLFSCRPERGGACLPMQRLIFCFCFLLLSFLSLHYIISTSVFLCTITRYAFSRLHPITPLTSPRLPVSPPPVCACAWMCAREGGREGVGFACVSTSVRLCASQPPRAAMSVRLSSRCSQVRSLPVSLVFEKQSNCTEVTATVCIYVLVSIPVLETPFLFDPRLLHAVWSCMPRHFAAAV